MLDRSVRASAGWVGAGYRLVVIIVRKSDGWVLIICYPLLASWGAAAAGRAQGALLQGCE